MSSAREPTLLQPSHMHGDKNSSTQQTNSDYAKGKPLLKTQSEKALCGCLNTFDTHKVIGGGPSQKVEGPDGMQWDAATN